MKRHFLALLALPAAALAVGATPVRAQPVGGGIYPGGNGGAASLAVGATPITGCATSGFILFNNAGTVGCQAAAGGGNVSNTGTPTAGQIAQWTNATTVQGLAVTGSGSAVLATSPTLTTPNLGTPSAVTLTNGTGLPCSGIASLATGVCTFLGTATSANLAALLTDETGTGANVFATGPTLSAPVADRYLVSTSNTNAQSGTTYTVTSSDCGKNIIASNAGAITISMNTGLSAGCWVTITQGGAGQVTVGGTATVNSANGKKTRAQYSVINLMYGGASDTYVLSGDSST